MSYDRICEYLVKDVVARLDYSFDWSEYLASGSDSIASSTWEQSPGIELANVSVVGDTTVVIIEKGNPGQLYKICNTIVTTQGRVDRRCITIGVYDQAGVALWDGSASVRGAVTFAQFATLLAKGRSGNHVQFDSRATFAINATVIKPSQVVFASVSDLVFVEPPQVVFASRLYDKLIGTSFDPNTSPPLPTDLWFGIALDAQYRTVLPPPSNTRVALNDAELLTGLNDLVNGSLDHLYLTPGGDYFYPRNTLSRGSTLNRTADNPAVIMTDPNADQTPGYARLRAIYEDSEQRWGGILFKKLFCKPDGLGGEVWLRSSAVGSNPQGSHDIFFEDCELRLLCQAGQDGSAGFVTSVTTDNLCLRFCKLMDNYSVASGVHRHGLFGVLTEFKIEYCVFDHNGWLPAAQGGTRSTDTNLGGPTPRSHNFYITKPNPPVIVRHCILSSTSAEHHMRPGGDFTDNLIWRSGSAGGQMGYGYDGKAQYGTSGGTFARNVILEGEDVNTSTNDFRGVGFRMSDIDGLIVEDNIFARGKSLASNYPGNRAVFGFDGPFSLLNITIRNNIAWDWVPNAPLNYLFNPQNRDLSGVTEFNNHFEDGSNYANPTIVDAYKHTDWIDYFRTNGVDPDELANILQNIRNGFVILP